MSRDTYYQFPKRKRQRIQRDKQYVERLHILSATDKNPKKHYRIGIQQSYMKYQDVYGETIARNKIARLKREYYIPTKIRMRRNKKPQQPKQQEYVVIPDNILKRQFTIDTPLFLVGTDVTYIWCPKLNRFVYLSLTRDFATGEVIGYSVSPHNDQTLVDATILDIEQNYGKEVFLGMIIHIDRGGTYTSKHYQQDVLETRGVTTSMSGKGKCLDNTPTESGNGHLKDWIDISDCMAFDDVVMEIDTVVRYYNEERPQWDRKKMTPVQYRSHLSEVPLTYFTCAEYWV